MASRRERRAQRFERRGEAKTEQSASAPVEHRTPHRSLFHRIYDGHYKALLIIPFLILALSIAQIAYQTATTGDFINKGVSLKGGITLTFPVDDDTAVTSDEIQSLLNARFPGSDIVVRSITEFGQLKAIGIEAAADTENDEELRSFEQKIIGVVAMKIPTATTRFSVEVIGPSLGESFFNQVFRAMCIAFLLMAMVVFLSFGQHTWAKVVAVILTLLAAFLVFSAQGRWMILPVLLIVAVIGFLYWKYSLPSWYVIICAFSDLVMTVAVVNVLGIKVSSAGVAAFLMLIGYSVDTDILLTTRVLKHKRGTVYERVLSSAKTGMTMSFASMAAALVGYFVSQSSTIKEILLIVAIGLVADVIMTWIQNVGLLRLYVEKRGIQ